MTEELFDLIYIEIEDCIIYNIFFLNQNMFSVVIEKNTQKVSTTFKDHYNNYESLIYIWSQFLMALKG